MTGNYPLESRNQGVEDYLAAAQFKDRKHEPKGDDGNKADNRSTADGAESLTPGVMHFGKA